MLITVIAEFLFRASEIKISATSRASGIRAPARQFQNRLSAEVADIAVGDSAMTVNGVGSFRSGVQPPTGAYLIPAIKNHPHRHHPLPGRSAVILGRVHILARTRPLPNAAARNRSRLKQPTRRSRYLHFRQRRAFKTPRKVDALLLVFAIVRVRRALVHILASRRSPHRVWPRKAVRAAAFIIPRAGRRRSRIGANRVRPARIRRRAFVVRRFRENRPRLHRARPGGNHAGLRLVRRACRTRRIAGRIRRVRARARPLRNIMRRIRIRRNRHRRVRRRVPAFALGDGRRQSRPSRRNRPVRLIVRNGYRPRRRSGATVRLSGGECPPDGAGATPVVVRVRMRVDGLAGSGRRRAARKLIAVRHLRLVTLAGGEVNRAICDAGRGDVVIRIARVVGQPRGRVEVRMRRQIASPSGDAAVAHSRHPPRAPDILPEITGE